MSAGLLYPAAVAVSALSAAVGLPGWVGKRGNLRRMGQALGVAALGVTVAAWILRWAEAGHVPLFGTYESALSLAVGALCVAAAWDFRVPTGARLMPWGGLVAAILLGHGLAFDPTPYALTISERSWVVDVHAALAWLAFGALTANAGLAMARLLRTDNSVRAERLFSLSLSVGFALHSGMMATGSLYKFLLFGRAWSFDPIETLGFAAWVAYGTLLHMDLLARWDARRLTPWCLGVFLLLVISYRAIVYFPAWSTYHIFDMDLRIHVAGPGP